MRPQFTNRRSRSQRRFPNQIREYRLRLGFTQKQVGALLGHDRSVISSWERGIALPSLPDLFRLARALNTLAEALYHSFWAVPQKDTKDESTESPRS